MAHMFCCAALSSLGFRMGAAYGSPVHHGFGSPRSPGSVLSVCQKDSFCFEKPKQVSDGADVL